MDLDNFNEWLTEASREIGAHSMACIRMDNPLLQSRVKENNTLVADWMNREMHGEMDYLERLFLDKSNPWKTFPFAKSVIVLTFSNRWGDPSATHPFPVPAQNAMLGYISAYAREADYHLTGQAMLSQLAKMLGDNIHAQATVDTAAVYERLFATVGGLGEIGSNNLLRVPGSGNSRVFIGCLFVDAELPEVIQDAKMPTECSSCLTCLKKCPSGAIQPGQMFDAKKCLSYLTIEKKGLLSRKEGLSIGDWLFGCDLCTMACPPQVGVDMRIPVDLEWLLKSSSFEIRHTIKGNATAYAGVTQLRKNAVVVLKNIATPRANDLLGWVAEKTGSELIRRQIDLW